MTRGSDTALFTDLNMTGMATWWHNDNEIIMSCCCSSFVSKSVCWGERSDFFMTRFQEIQDKTYYIHIE